MTIFAFLNLTIFNGLFKKRSRLELFNRVDGRVLLLLSPIGLARAKKASFLASGIRILLLATFWAHFWQVI
jgi:hypothetical protein